MRPTWSGAVGFGLVNIPVKLYSATEDKGGLKFRFLHKKDLSPVGYAKVCKNEGVEIQQDDIVRGFEYEKDEFVVIEDEDFARANPKKSKTVEILDFVCVDEIDPIYYEKSYFLVPDRGADKPYALLLETLRRSEKAGVARFVLRDKEALAVIRPYGEVLALHQIRFADEVRDVAGLKVPDVDAKSMKKELDMALSLVDQMTSAFEPEQYHDTYSEELRHVIDEKVKGQAPSKTEEKAATGEVHDIMAALKASLKGSREKAVA